MPDKVRIEISADKLRAYLEILIPTTAQWQSFAELMQELEEVGVKYGINTDLLRKRLRDKNQDRIVVAEGTPEVSLKQQMEGMDGRFSKLAPEEQETKVGLVRNLQHYQRIQQELITKKNALLYEMKEFIAETGYIKTHRRIYQGVKVKIGAAVLLVKYEVPFTALISCKKGRS